MTAGSAATRIDQEVVAHPTSSNLPYQPRMLSRGERSRREIFVFHSPRNDRVVTIAEFLHVAIALKFEFDPNLLCYVERPRRIALSARQEIDVSFWTRDRNGNERFYLAVPNAGTSGSTTGTVAIRDRDALDAAAERHGIRLTYITEREMISSMADCITSFELLHHVWAYRRIAARSLIRAQILGLLANSARTTLANLIQTLTFHPSSVRAVVAAMIHDGTLRQIEYTPGATQAILEVTRGA